MGKLNLGLALGGGGARGAAHIGVLQVLHDHGLKISALSGSSAGAVIGAMYAASGDPYWIEKRFYEFMDTAVFKALGTDRMLDDHNPDSVFSQFAKSIRDNVVIMVARNRAAIIKREKLKRCIEFLVPVKDFNDLQIPLKAVTADLNSGDTIIYESGDLIEAVTRSSSIPGFVPPFEEDDRLLVDGGISAPTPVTQLLDCTDFVIASDISKRVTKPLGRQDIIEISMRAEQVTTLYYNTELLKKADFVIRPQVMGLHWSRFDQFERLVQAGRVVAEAELEHLEQSIRSKGRLINRFRRWLKKYP